MDGDPFGPAAARPGGLGIGLGGGLVSPDVPVPGPDDPASRLRDVAAGARPAGPNESFAGAILPAAALRGLDLAGTDLARADLSDAMGGGVKLAGACLEQATLSRADLTGADLAGVRGGQAVLEGALIEDATLDGAAFRFAHFNDAVLDGSSLVGTDLWGAVLSGLSAERTCLRDARLDEAKAAGAHFQDSDLSGASLRRADFSGACLRGATLRDAQFNGASFHGADLTGAVLPFADLVGCNLVHVRWAGAWLERTRMTAGQLGGAVGEEAARDYRAAYDAYTALELNFRSLGNGEDESWAYRKRRRMGKLAHRAAVAAAFRRPVTLSAALAAWRHGGSFLVDSFVEWLSDYGESLTRVLRAFVVILLLFAALFWVTGGLVPREDMPGSANRGWAVLVLDHLLFSLNSMTTVGPGLVELKPASELAVLLSSLETVLGTVLIGLFGFVLGARMRR